MKRISGLALSLVLLVSGCAGVPNRPLEPGRPESSAQVERADDTGPRPDGLDRWYRPWWGPPWTVSAGYAWVYRPCD